MFTIKGVDWEFTNDYAKYPAGVKFVETSGWWRRRRVVSVENLILRQMHRRTSRVVWFILVIASVLGGL